MSYSFYSYSNGELLVEYHGTTGTSTVKFHVYVDDHRFTRFEYKTCRHNMGFRPDRQTVDAIVDGALNFLASTMDLVTETKDIVRARFPIDCPVWGYADKEVPLSSIRPTTAKSELPIKILCNDDGAVAVLPIGKRGIMVVSRNGYPFAYYGDVELDCKGYRMQWGHALRALNNYLNSCKTNPNTQIYDIKDVGDWVPADAIDLANYLILRDAPEKLQSVPIEDDNVPELIATGRILGKRLPALAFSIGAVVKYKDIYHVFGYPFADDFVGATVARVLLTKTRPERDHQYDINYPVGYVTKTSVQFLEPLGSFETIDCSAMDQLSFELLCKTMISFTSR